MIIIKQLLLHVTDYDYISVAQNSQASSLVRD